MWTVRNLSKQASTYKDGKNASSKKLQIKANPNNATGNILKLLKVWYNIKYYYSFCYPKTNFVLQFFHI